MALVTEKKGGPYSAKERKLRREQVAELFFDRGLNVVNISRTLNVNRNTITKDLNFCYLKLNKEFVGFNPTIICMTQFHRMENQRARLVDFLYKDLEFKDRLRLEKMVSDIENKIMLTALKFQTNKDQLLFGAQFLFNRWAKNQNPKFRGYTRNTIHKLSEKTADEIEDLIEEDKKNISGFTYF